MGRSGRGDKKETGCHQRKFPPEEAKPDLRISSCHKQGAYCFCPSGFKKKSILFFSSETNFLPLPPPSLEKFKRYRKVKLSHSYFPELTTVNIWSYFPLVFFLRNNMFQIPNLIPSNQPTLLYPREITFMSWMWVLPIH